MATISYDPRTPTPAERNELRDYISATGSDPTLVDSVFIAVFDHFVTGSPGYAGKIMTVIWDGSPSTYDVYVWTNGNIDYVAKEGG